MIRKVCHWRRTQLALLAGLALGLGPTVAEAGIISFRNETDMPIMVQGVSIINRVARRGRLLVLRPGEVVRELHLVPGTKLIIVADAKQPTRILCQEIIQFTGSDLFYAIQPVGLEKAREAAAGSPMPKGRKAFTPRVKLVPSLPVPLTPLPSSNPRR